MSTTEPPEVLTATVLVEGLVFPECPRWHAERLWFSDIHAHQVLAADLAGRTAVVVRTTAEPAGLGFLSDGRLLVVTQRDRRLHTVTAEGLQLVADLSALEPVALNDMVVDGQGRAYIGGFGFELVAGAPPQPGNIYLVAPGSEARIAAGDLLFPNGMVVSPDGDTLIVAESAGRRLTAFAIAPDGGLTGRRVFAELGRAIPDGICLDAAGGVWVASFRAGEFLRVADGGAVTHRVPTPGKAAVACMLGGPDRRTLFLCTAQTTPEDLAQGRSIGFIETVDVDTPGAGWP
jgi:sugar lactone lactonase YvrE